MLPLTIATFVKAVVAIAMVGKDDNVVSALLQPNRRIDNQPLRTADAQVGMEEDDCAVLGSRPSVCLQRHGERAGWRGFWCCSIKRDGTWPFWNLEQKVGA